MAKAIFTRRFDASNTKKGVSIRIEPMDLPQSFPEWVVAKAVEAGAAERYNPKPQAAAGKTGDK